MSQARDQWDVADPQETLDAIIARSHPADGDVIVAMLRSQDGGAREIVDVTVVHPAGQPIEQLTARDRLRRHAQSTAPSGLWNRGKARTVDHVFVTVVCRSGRVLPGPTELFWSLAWRYSNHLTDAFFGDIYILTPHGWTGVHDRRAGFTPALTKPSDIRVLRQVL